MKFFLIVAKGKKRGLPIPIDVDLFLIGSDKACQLRAHHDGIGEQHCAMVNRGKKVFIRDLGSGKITKVNGSELPRSEEWPLHKGDLVTVGPLVFKINFSERQLSQRDLEEWALKTLDEDHGPRVSAFEEFDAAMKATDQEFAHASDAAAAMLSKASAMKGVVRGHLRITLEGRITIVRINETYLVEEAELAHLKMELRENLSTPNLRVVLDLKNVRRMSSAAVTMFAELSVWLKKTGSVMALCRMRPDLCGSYRPVRALKFGSDRARLPRRVESGRSRSVTAPRSPAENRRSRTEADFRGSCSSSSRSISWRTAPHWRAVAMVRAVTWIKVIVQIIVEPRWRRKLWIVSGFEARGQAWKFVISQKKRSQTTAPVAASERVALPVSAAWVTPRCTSISQERLAIRANSAQPSAWPMLCLSQR